MIDRGRHSVLGVLVDAVDLEAATERVMEAARQGRPFGVSALAVHGVMSAADDPELQHRLNDLEMVVADGQPVRWALNWLYRADLPERVYGPALTLSVAERAAREGLPVYLYGSTGETLERLELSLRRRWPDLRVAGRQPSRFRSATEEEREEDILRIRESGARIVLVGLGCPRQEVWAFENRKDLSMPVLAVGAAFDYHAGKLRRPPAWMQRAGLEWVHRLLQEPGRLWRRYLLLNPRYLALLALQAAGLRSIGPERAVPPATMLRPG